MRIDAEEDGVQFDKENDDCIISIGKVIRMLRIDELPQLLNIVVGNMSLVEPRFEKLKLQRNIYTITFILK